MNNYEGFYAITNPVLEKFEYEVKEAKTMLTQTFLDVFTRGYELGHEDGLKEKPEKIYEMQKESFEKGVQKAEESAKEVRDKAIEEAYFSALGSAWECARRVISLWVNSIDKFAEIFGKGKSLNAVMKEFSASEAANMINEYEKKKEQMTVEEAKAIIEKLDKCQSRIIDTSYCEHNGCNGCDLRVSQEDINKAREVLNG